MSVCHITFPLIRHLGIPILFVYILICGQCRDFLSQVKACKRGDTQAIKNIISSYDIDYDVAAYLNASDTNGSHSIFHTVWPGHHAALELLLKHRADPNKVNNRLNTALHLACERMNKKIVTLLIQYGAKTDVENAKKLLCYQTCYTPDEQMAMKSLVDRLVVAREGGYQVDNTILRPPKSTDFTPFNSDFYTLRRKKEFELANAVAAAHDVNRVNRNPIASGYRADAPRPIRVLSQSGRQTESLHLPVLNRGDAMNSSMRRAPQEHGGSVLTSTTRRELDMSEKQIPDRSGKIMQRPISRDSRSDQASRLSHVTTWVRAMSQVRPNSAKTRTSENTAFSHHFLPHQTFLDPLPAPVGHPDIAQISHNIRNMEERLSGNQLSSEKSSQSTSSSPSRRSRPQTTDTNARTSSTSILTTRTSGISQHVPSRIPTFRMGVYSRGIPTTATIVEPTQPWENAPGKRAKTAGWYNPRQGTALGYGHGISTSVGEDRVNSARGSTRSEVMKEQAIDWNQVGRELRGKPAVSSGNSGVNGNGRQPSAMMSPIASNTGQGTEDASENSETNKRPPVDIRRMIQVDNKRHLYRYYYRGQYDEEPIPENILNAGKEQEQGKKGKDSRKNDAGTSVVARNRRLFSAKNKNVLLASLQSIGRGLLYLRAPIIKHKLLKRLEQWRQNPANDFTRTQTNKPPTNVNTSYSFPTDNNSSLTELNSNSLMNISLGVRVRGHRRASETLRQDLAKLEMVIRTMQAGRRMAPPPLPLLRDVWSTVDGDHAITPLLEDEEERTAGKNDFSGQNAPANVDRTPRSENQYFSDTLGVGPVVDVYEDEEKAPEEDPDDMNTTDADKIRFLKSKKRHPTQSKPVYTSLSAYVQAEEEKQRRASMRQQRRSSRSPSVSRASSSRKKEETLGIQVHSETGETLPMIGHLNASSYVESRPLTSSSSRNHGVQPSHSLRLAMESARRQRTAINVTGRRNSSSESRDSGSGFPSGVGTQAMERGTNSIFSQLLNSSTAPQHPTLTTLQEIIDATPLRNSATLRNSGNSMHSDGAWILRDSEGNPLPPPNTPNDPSQAHRNLPNTSLSNKHSSLYQSTSHSTVYASSRLATDASRPSTSGQVYASRPSTTASSNAPLHAPVTDNAEAWQALASRADIPVTLRDHATRQAQSLSQSTSGRVDGTHGGVGFSAVVPSLAGHNRVTSVQSSRQINSTPNWRQSDETQRIQSAKIHAANDRRTEWLRMKARKGREDDKFLKALQGRL